MLDIIAQIFGVIAMSIMVWSYQLKKQKHIIAMQLFGTAFFAVHFFMIKAYVGSLLNVVGIIRAFVFLNKDKFKSESIVWQFVFFAAFIASYALTFIVFGKEFNLKNALVEMLPVIGMTAMSIAFRCKDAKSTRMLCLINSPSWLIYNLFNFSIGGMLCDTFSLISVIVGILRLDRKKKLQGEQVNE